jgi:hypothetical protein
MIQNILDLLSNPIVMGFIFTIIGTIVKTFFPQIMPLVGPAEKMIKELVIVLDKCDSINENIVASAYANKDIKKADKFLDEQLLKRK